MIILLLSLLFFIFPQPIRAIYDPLSVPNNTYGMHIVDPNDIPDIPPLVNSNGGDWGYVTMILSDRDRDPGKWQSLFDQMRRNHLIPIIRLATHTEGENWVIPQKDRFYEIVKLLNSLHWPTANRYIMLYNEPNHAKEWGGTISPEEYAGVFVEFATQLKAANEDFFILPAAIDASSSNYGGTIDAAIFLRRMFAAKPEIRDLIDGWNSHSYPNPGFSASPLARGRGTLTSYDWELSYLKSLGLTKNLPVFITETGWMHSSGVQTQNGFLSPEEVSSNLSIAASTVWTDPRIAAVTPFIFNYQDVPFDHFSWKMLGSNLFYPMYQSYQNIPKQKGEPVQHERYSLMTSLIPETLVSGSTYTLSATIENTGQGILGTQNGYTLKLSSPEVTIETIVDSLPNLEPFEKGDVNLFVKLPDITGTYPITAQIVKNDVEILLQSKSVNIIEPPTMKVRAKLGWKNASNSQLVDVLIYKNDTLMQKNSDLQLKNGIIQVSGLRNIIPGSEYRTVILIPGYLPRQVIGQINAAGTIISPKRFLPLDFNGDGQFTIDDLVPMIRLTPHQIFSRFFGL